MESLDIKHLMLLYEEEHDYFECHELLEAAWKKDVLDLSKDNAYVVLLQFIVSVHHLNKKNFNGALKLYNSLCSHYTEQVRSDLNKLVDVQIFNQQLRALKEKIDNQTLGHLELHWRN